MHASASCFTLGASSWDYGTSRTCNQRRLRRACTSAQSCQGHKCSHTRNVDEGACLKLGSPQQFLAFRGRIASRGRLVPVFLLGNKWQLMIFMGRSGPPAPSVSASDPINITSTVWIHILFIFFTGPGQFTKCLLIISSADAKGKDSMILFKIKETAHINSGHVLF